MGFGENHELLFFVFFFFFQTLAGRNLNIVLPDEGVTLQRAKSYLISTVHWCITTYRISNTEDLFFPVTL